MKSPIVLTIKAEEALVEEVLGMSEGRVKGGRRLGNVNNRCPSESAEVPLVMQRMLMFE